jgi:hypothetical protein
VRVACHRFAPSVRAVASGHVHPSAASESGSSAPLRRRTPRRFATSTVSLLFTLLCLFFASPSLRAQETYEAYSPVVSYVFEESLAGAEAYSPAVSYVFLEALPGDVTTEFTSAPVSYFYNVSAGGPPVTLHGEVYLPDGQPAANALVTVSLPGRMVASTPTGPQGGFSLPNLATEVVLVEASLPGFRPDRRVVLLSAQTAVQRFQLGVLAQAPPLAEQPPGSVDTPLTRPPVNSATGSRLLVFDGTGWSAQLGLRPDVPTVVFTHGWQLCTAAITRENEGVNGWPKRLAHAMRSAGITPDVANLVAWDWFDAARPCFAGSATITPPEEKTPEQGVALGQVLHETLGGAYAQRVHFLGHSLGTLVNSYAADYVHGHSRTGGKRASPAWDSSRTEMTLFDEAAIARMLSIESFEAAVLGLKKGVKGALIAYGLAAVQWKNPIPRQSAWLENYISSVGRFREGGVNVLLQRSLWETILTNRDYILKFPAATIEAHSYPMVWYGKTIGAPPRGTIGWGHSVEWNALSGGTSFPPERDLWIRPGQLWWQSWAGDELILELADDGLAAVPPAVTGVLIGLGRFEHDVVSSVATHAAAAALAARRAGEDAMDWIGEQADRFGNWVAGTARKVGDAAVELAGDAAEAASDGFEWVVDGVGNVGSSVWNATERFTFRVRLRTGPTSPSPSPRRAGQPEPVNTPAYLWLPVVVPATAEFLTFEFSREGEPAEDALVVGFGDEALFSLKGQFIPTAELSTSPLLDVRAWAGTTNEFFFGLVGGSSTNCTATIENIRFYTLQPPQLTVEPAGADVLLSWPSTANGYAVEQAEALVAEGWQATTNPPALFGGRFWQTNAVTEQTRFFRLRRQ